MDYSGLRLGERQLSYWTNHVLHPEQFGLCIISIESRIDEKTVIFIYLLIRIQGILVIFIHDCDLMLTRMTLEQMLKFIMTQILFVCV